VGARCLSGPLAKNSRRRGGSPIGNGRRADSLIAGALSIWSGPKIPSNVAPVQKMRSKSRVKKNSGKGEKGKSALKNWAKEKNSGLESC